MIRLEIKDPQPVLPCRHTATLPQIAVCPDDLARGQTQVVAVYHVSGLMLAHHRVSELAGLPDPVTGMTLFQLPIPDDLPPAAAVALVDAGLVKTFLSLGHRPVTAADGPAAGAQTQGSAAGTIAFPKRDHTDPTTAEQAPTAICLSAGTRVDTKAGEIAIEDLQIGQLVRTLDNGYQPIRMIQSRTLSGELYRRNRQLWPVCIQAGALGFGLPSRPMRVSPQHKMLFRHIRIPLMFGEDAVFVRAKSLAAGFDDIYVDSTLDQVTYYHLVFDRHEVIYAEGAPTESFHPGPEGLATLDAEARTEFFDIFPEYSTGTSPATRYATLRSWELMAMVG